MNKESHPTNTPTPSSIPNFSNAEPVGPDHPHPGATAEKSCGAVIVQGGTVLLISQQNGLTGFPKGHVEPGETEPETALREVREETGLAVTLDPATRYTFSYYIPRLNVEKTVVLFLARLAPTSGALHKQDAEIAGAAWVPFAEVESHLNFPEWQRAWHNIHAKFIE